MNETRYSSPSVVYTPTTAHFEDEDESRQTFLTIEERHGFARKVFLVFAVIFLVMCFHIVLNPFGQSYDNLLLVLIPLFGSVMAWFSFVLFEPVARRWPVNLVVLSLFTLTTGEFFVFDRTYNNQFFTVCFLVAAGCLVCLALFTLQARFKLDLRSGGAISCVCLLIAAGFAQLAVEVQLLTTLYASALALVILLYVVHEVVAMIEGNHRTRITTKEWPFGAITVLTARLCCFGPFFYNNRLNVAHV